LSADSGAVLDADFFAQQLDLLLEPLDLGPETEAGIEALSGPAKGGDQGEIGKGDGVHGCRANATRPAPGKRKRSCDAGHGRPPEETQR